MLLVERYASTANGPIADLGCGYGAVAKRLLNAGCREVIANDLSQGQLDIFFNSLSSDEKKQVRVIPGNALDIGSSIADASLAGIFAASWLNFLNPDEIQRAFKVFYKLLQPGK